MCGSPLLRPSCSSCGDRRDAGQPRIVEGSTIFRVSAGIADGDRRTVGVCANCCSIATPSWARWSAGLSAIGVGRGPGRGRRRDRRGSASRACWRRVARFGRSGRDDGRCALAAARSSRTPSGASRGSCSNRCAPADWDELTVGAAALVAPRARSRARPSRRWPATPMHAAVHGLVWLACNLAERAPTLLIVDDVHWADAASLRWLVQLARRLEELPLGVLCAVRAGEPRRRAGACSPSCSRRPPSRRSGRDRSAPPPPRRSSPRGCPPADAGVRACLPRRHRPATRSCCGALLGHLVAERDRARRGQVAPAAERVRARPGRARRRAPARRGSRTAPRALARALRGPRPRARRCATPPGSPRLEPRRRRPRWPTRCAPPDSCTATGRSALAHPLIAGALYAQPGARRARALARPTRRACCSSDERADPERVALHLLRTEPAGDPATVAALRAAAASAPAPAARPRAPPASCAAPLAEPPLDPRRRGATCTGELGLALRRPRPARRARACCAKPSSSPPRPPQRCRDRAARRARARPRRPLRPRASTLSRRGLERPRRHCRPSDRERLEAELVCNGWHARRTTVAEAPSTAAGSALGALPTRALARQRRHGRRCCDGRARAASVHALLEPAPRRRRARPRVRLAPGHDRHHRARSPTTTSTPRPRAATRSSIIARPRGWLIALAHGSFMRAMALVRAGRIRDAEADARFAFDFKLANSPAPALLWSLHPLVDALTELDELDAADAALAAAGQLGDPPAGALAAPLLLETPGAAAARPAPPRRRARRPAQPPPHRWSELERPPRRPSRPGASRPPSALTAMDEIAAGTPARRGAPRSSPSASALPVRRAPACARLAHAGDPDERIALLEQRGRAARRLARAARAHARARRPRRRPAPRQPPPRRPCAAAPRARPRRPPRHAPARPPRARTSCSAAGARPRRAALSGIDALTPTEHRVATLAARGPQQPRDRPTALRHPPHRRDPPHPRLPEARHQCARRAPCRPGRGRRPLTRGPADSNPGLAAPLPAR